MVAETRALIENITPLTNSILQVWLSPLRYIDYIAGQYLQIIVNNEPLSYSIANAPLGSHKYELHIRHSKENLQNERLLNEIKKKGQITIKLPLGHCHLNHIDKNKPILFIAAGTGFAPMKAMIEQLLAENNSSPFELFWTARSQSDLYLDEKLSSWQKHVSHFKYFSQAAENKMTVAKQVLEEHPNDLNKWQIVINGPMEMVLQTKNELEKHNRPLTHLFSDAFS